VLFLSHGSGPTVRLLRDGAHFGLRAIDGAAATVDLRFVGAAPNPSARAVERLRGVSHYYTGEDRRKWVRDVPHFGRVVYDGVWPGVDVAFHATGSDLEYDFIVASGADPARIALAMDGDPHVDERSGDLVLRTGGHEVHQPAPRLYQEVGGVRQVVGGGYRMVGDRRVGFAIGTYDRSRPLVIDPVLAFGTYADAFGSPGGTVGWDATTDDHGNAYAVGRINPGDEEPNAVILKRGPDGSVVYQAEIGYWRSFDEARAVAVDAAGNAWIAGFTSAPDHPGQWFPRTADAYQFDTPGATEAGDAFLLELTPSGALAYSTLFGGSGQDLANAIAIGGDGAIYVAGRTASVDLPIVAGAHAQLAGGRDGFIAKFDATGAIFFIRPISEEAATTRPTRWRWTRPVAPGWEALPHRRTFRPPTRSNPPTAGGRAMDSSRDTIPTAALRLRRISAALDPSLS
jgi:hypothetical protein